MKQLSRQQLWQKRKQQLGLCIRCGKNPLHTKNYCESCEKKNIEGTKRWVAQNHSYYIERLKKYREKKNGRKGTTKASR